MTKFEPILKGTQAEEKSIQSALQVLRMPGAFLRQTDSETFPYEAVYPGTWTRFQSSGLKKQAFEIMMKRERLSMVPGRTDRWTLDGTLQSADRKSDAEHRT